MSSKLTLYIEDELITYVKKYAKEHHSSVSKVVNNFLIALKQQEEEEKRFETPLTDALLGSVEPMDASKETYYKHLEEKYL